MESLVFYNRALLRHHSTRLDAAERQRLVDKCLEMLDTLCTVDPYRRQRYADLREMPPIDVCRNIADNPRAFGKVKKFSEPGMPLLRRIVLQHVFIVMTVHI